MFEAAAARPAFPPYIFQVHSSLNNNKAKPISGFPRAIVLARIFYPSVFPWHVVLNGTQRRLLARAESSPRSAAFLPLSREHASIVKFVREESCVIMNALFAHFFPPSLVYADSREERA